MLAGIGLVIAALTPRRGLGVAAIIAVLTVSPGCRAPCRRIADEEGADTVAGYAGLFSPFTLVDGVQTAFLGAELRLPEAEPPGALGGAVFVLSPSLRRRRLLRRPAAPLPEGVGL